MLVARAYGQARLEGGAPDPAYSARALDAARLFAARKRHCGADVACLVSAHVGVLRDLSHDGSQVAVPPAVAAPT